MHLRRFYHEGVCCTLGASKARSSNVMSILIGQGVKATTEADLEYDVIFCSG